MPRRAATIAVTTTQLRHQWDALFARHPWLDGLTSSGGCESVFCCPPSNIPDWTALSEAQGVLFLAGGDTHTPRLTQQAFPAKHG